ncbi:19857_t:CDS:2, partial [Racocetra fulgida]
MENNDTLILNWTPFFGEQTWEHYRIDYCGSDLPPCLITHNPTYLIQSHLLVFHAPDVNWEDLPDKEIRNIYNNKMPWVYYSAEAPAREWEFDDDKMKMFEFSLSYRLDSDFPSTYLDEDLTAIIRSPSYQFKDRKQVPVAWVVSNCHASNGVVPIVDGPSDYTPFAPTNHSLIQIDQFSSPEDLASYILSLSENEQAYTSYLSYKNNSTPLSEEFVKYWQ